MFSFRQLNWQFCLALLVLACALDSITSNPRIAHAQRADDYSVAAQDKQQATRLEAYKAAKQELQRGIDYLIAEFKNDERAHMLARMAYWAQQRADLLNWYRQVKLKGGAEDSLAEIVAIHEKNMGEIYAWIEQYEESASAYTMPFISARNKILREFGDLAETEKAVLEKMTEPVDTLLAPVRECYLQFERVKQDLIKELESLGESTIPDKTKLRELQLKVSRADLEDLATLK